MTRHTSLKTLALLACTMMAGPSMALPQYGADTGAPEPTTAPTGTSTSSSGGKGGEACAVLSSQAASLLAAASAAGPNGPAPTGPGGAPPDPFGNGSLPQLGPNGIEVDPKIAMDCLNSIPFDKDAAAEFIGQVTNYYAFQSTLGDLANPPKESRRQPLDLLAGMSRITSDIKSGKISSQYDMEMQVSNLLGAANDGHLFFQGGASNTIRFQFPVAVASVSKDGIELPKVYMATVGPSFDIPDAPAFGPVPGAPAITKIDGQDVVEYLTNITSTQGLQEVDTRYNTAFASNTRDGIANNPGGFNSRSFHPGKDSVEFTFENGKTMSFPLQAVIGFDTDFTGVTDGESFKQKFVLGGVQTGLFAPDPSCPPDPNASLPPFATGMPAASGTSPAAQETGKSSSDSGYSVDNGSEARARLAALAQGRRRRVIAKTRTAPKSDFSKGEWKKKYEAIVRKVAEVHGTLEPTRAKRQEEESGAFPSGPKGFPGGEGPAGTAAPTAEPTLFPVGVNLGPGGTIVAQNGKTFFGSFIDDDTAVMSIDDFEPCSLQGLQTAVASFIDQCRATKKKHLILEVFGNGGGLVAGGFDVFKQLFPGDEPKQFSRIRANEAAKIYAETFSPFTEEQAAADPDGAAGAAIFSGFSKATTLDENGKPFATLDDFFGPVFQANDNFTHIQTFNFSDPNGVGFDPDFSITGFGALSANASAEPPFSPDNIVLLTDGICSSTCTVLAELLQHQKGVKSVFVGGLPQKAPAAAIGGVRGSQTLEIGDLLTDSQIMDEFFPAKTSDEKSARQVLPQNTTFTFQGQINFRDSVRKGETTALQFTPDKANCRLFYTAESFTTPLFFYKQVKDVAWGNGKCAQGSIQGGGSQGASGSQSGSNEGGETQGAGGSQGGSEGGKSQGGSGSRGGEGAEGNAAGATGGSNLRTEGCAPTYSPPPTQGEPPAGGEPPEGEPPMDSPPTYGAPPAEPSAPSHGSSYRRRRV